MSSLPQGSPGFFSFSFCIYFANQLEQLRKHYLMEIRKQQLMASQYVHYLREVLAQGQTDHNLEMCVDGVHLQRFARGVRIVPVLFLTFKCVLTVRRRRRSWTRHDRHSRNWKKKWKHGGRDYFNTKER